MTTNDAPDKPYKLLGEAITQLRKRASMTQGDLAAAMNTMLHQQNDSITQSAISYWERGTHAPTGGKLKVLAAIFNVHPAKLAALRADVDTDLGEVDDAPTVAGSHGLEGLSPAQRDEVLLYAEYIRHRDSQ